MKSKVVKQFQGNSLEELDFSPGELVGFKVLDYGSIPPFILGYADKIVKEGDYPGIYLSFFKYAGTLEKFTFYFGNKILALNIPKKINEVLEPDYDPYFTRNRIFTVEAAYAGKENIVSGLREFGRGFEFYADLIEKGRLVEYRDILDRFIQKIGLGTFLYPPDLRFM